MSTAAAGGVQSCARDLATWLLFQLGDGTFESKSVVSSEAMAEMHSPQIFVPTTPAFRAQRQIRRFAAHGFGWQIWDYRGHTLIWHSGSGDGQSAYLALLPERRLGVAVLVNTWKTGGSGYNAALASRIMDHYLGDPPRDYVTEYAATRIRAEEKDAEEQAKLTQSRLANTKPSLPLPAYAGAYRDRLDLGVEVTFGAALVLRYAGGQPATLEHWHRDVFRAHWENPLADQERQTFVSFRLDEPGAASGLTWNRSARRWMPTASAS